MLVDALYANGVGTSLAIRIVCDTNLESTAGNGRRRERRPIVTVIGFRQNARQALIDNDRSTLLRVVVEDAEGRIGRAPSGGSRAAAVEVTPRRPYLVISRRKARDYPFSGIGARSGPIRTVHVPVVRRAKRSVVECAPASRVGGCKTGRV